MTIRFRQARWGPVLWLLAHIGLLVYAMRIPGTGLYVYRILYFTEALLLLLQGKGTHKYHTGKKALRRTAISWCYIAVQGAIVALTNRRGGDWQELVWILCMPAVCFVLCYYAVDRDLYAEVFRVFIIVSVLLALFGVYESVTGHILNKTTGSYYYRRNMFRLTAPNTIFYNINDHAVFMTMCLFLSWIWAEGRKNRKALRGAFLALFGFNVLMVASYGALVSIAFFLLVQYLVKSNSQRKRVRRLLAFLAAVLFAAAFLLAGGLPDEGIGEDRFTIWGNAVRDFRTSPVFGVGPGVAEQMNEERNPGHTAKHHNFFLEGFADYGLLGGGMLLAWYFSLLLQARKEGRKSLKCRYVFCTMTAFLPLTIVTSTLFNRSWLIVFLALLVVQVCHSASRKEIIPGSWIH